MAEPAEQLITTRTLSTADFTAPIGDRYFEDYQTGTVYEYGYVEVTEAEILAFARRFDPQPIHVDAAFAAAGPFGGLIASGWHTGAIFMRMFADHYVTRVASLASPGIDELRWPAPRSKPDRGLVRTRGELLNQDDRAVLSLIAMNLFGLRDAAEGGGGEGGPGRSG
jgi:acyl dehydratase